MQSSGCPSALVCKALKYLAIYGEGSSVKLETAARFVWPFSCAARKDFHCSPRVMMDRAIDEIADIIQNA